MVLVDSSVWIDFFGNSLGHKVDLLATMIRQDKRILLGDLVLAEVLQGLRSDREFQMVRKALLSLEPVQLVTPSLAIKSAQNYRLLRGAGITVRKTIDCLIATWCIEHGVPLLFSDRDFLPFQEYLGLQGA